MIYSVSAVKQKDPLWNACSEFVGSIFYDVFRKMYDSIPQSNLIHKSPAEKWYTDMLLYEYSKEAAKNDLKPLVDMIYKKLAAGAYR
ncbi:MAG: rod-binding protein [Pseudothermotoga sp.]